MKKLLLSLLTCCASSATLTTSTMALAANPWDGAGVSDASKLKASGSVSPGDGQIVENLKISGYIKATGRKNITIRNCLIDAGGRPYGIRVDGASGIKIDHVEILNVSSAGVYGGGFVMTKANIHHSAGDGAKPGSNSTVASSWIHHLGYKSPDAHADGVQIRGSHDVIIKDNFFDLANDVPDTKSNSAVFLQGNGSTPSNKITVSGNALKGGNFALHLYTDGGDPKTVSATGNLCYKGSTRYGFGSLQKGVVWSGNLINGTTTICKTTDK